MTEVSNITNNTANNNEVKIEGAFLTGPIIPTMLKFSIPVLLALFLQAFYGAVDLWAVGQFCGAAEVSAVSTGSQTMLIINGLVTGLALGTTVLLGMRIGEGDSAGASRVIGTSIYVFTGLGAALTVLVMVLARPIALLMNAPAEALEHTVAYIRICGAGCIFIAAYNLTSAIFRGMGNSRAPLVFVAIASVVNIVGDILLTKVFNLGAAGVAIATTAAQAISVVLSLLLMKKHGLAFKLTRETLRPEKGTALGVIKLGFPVALQDMCNELSYLIVIGLVNNLGLTIAAGVGIAEKIAMFIFLVPLSYMQSVSAFVAQNTGAGLHTRARRAMWDGMLTAAIIGGGIALLTFFFGDVLSAIFIEEAEVIAVSAEFLKATSIECFVLSIAYCFTGYFNGIGKTAFVMTQSIFAGLAVRVPLAWLMTTRATPVVFHIGLAETAASLFLLLVCAGYYIINVVKNLHREKK